MIKAPPCYIIDTETIENLIKKLRFIKKWSEKPPFAEINQPTLHNVDVLDKMVCELSLANKKAIKPNIIVPDVVSLIPLNASLVGELKKQRNDLSKAKRLNLYGR